MSRIENHEQLARTIAERDELAERQKALEKELISVSELINDLQVEILDYYDRGGNDDSETS